MAVHERAGKPAEEQDRVNIPYLMGAYYEMPAASRVSFGTSGHRGSSMNGSFQQSHIVAVAQAVVEFRQAAGITGPLFVGMDTHALSEAAWCSAIEVFAANAVEIRYQEGRGYTPTPAVSRAILAYNAGRTDGLADGVIITPSHNPPQDGGFKYNPPSGGPADSAMTKQIQDRANELLDAELKGVKRLPLDKALALESTKAFDYVTPYVEALSKVIDMESIAQSKLRIGVDPMGGAGAGYWGRIAEVYGLDMTVVNERLDPAFMFMRLDWDGKIRMDCSSPYAMGGLIDMKDQFDIAFGNDADFDRHGIVTPVGGLMNPNHYLSVAVDYLFTHRAGWPSDAAIGKTLVSSSMIDRVAAGLGRHVAEVPVGFKYFVEGLQSGTYGFGGEESAGASFLQQDGSVWTTDKDGILLDLLAAEIKAVTGTDPAARYAELEAVHGAPVYARIDAVATGAQKKVLSALDSSQLSADTLGGEAIENVLTHAPANGAPIGGVKVVTQNGWFAARPSGTEDVYKIYAESFLGEAHLQQIQEEAQMIVGNAFKAAGL